MPALRNAPKPPARAVRLGSRILKGAPAAGGGAGGASVRSSSTYASTASETAPVITLPAGWQAGDVVYLFWELRATSGVISAPTGWTAVVASFASGSNTSSAMAVFRRVMQAGDTNPTGSTTSGRSAVVAVAVQGADNVTPEDVTPTSDNNGASASSTATAPSITPVSANCLLLCGFGLGDPTTANTGDSYAAPSPAMNGIVAQVATSIAAQTDAAMMVASMALGAPAATSAETSTITASPTNNAVNTQGATVAVRSAAAAGATAAPAPLTRAGVRLPARLPRGRVFIPQFAPPVAGGPQVLPPQFTRGQSWRPRLPARRGRLTGPPWPQAAPAGFTRPDTRAPARAQRGHAVTPPQAVVWVPLLARAGVRPPARVARGRVSTPPFAPPVAGGPQVLPPQFTRQPTRPRLPVRDGKTWQPPWPQITVVLVYPPEFTRQPTRPRLPSRRGHAWQPPWPQVAAAAPAYVPRLCRTAARPLLPAVRSHRFTPPAPPAPVPQPCVSRRLRPFGVARRGHWAGVVFPGAPPPAFAVARSTPTVADPRDGKASVTQQVT